MKKAKKFFYLFFFILFVIYLYSQEKCYPKFGDIFGLSNLPLQTYGFFIAMAFLFGAIFLKDELNRLYLTGKIKPIKRKKESKARFKIAGTQLEYGSAETNYDPLKHRKFIGRLICLNLYNDKHL